MSPEHGEPVLGACAPGPGLPHPVPLVPRLPDHADLLGPGAQGHHRVLGIVSQLRRNVHHNITHALKYFEKKNLDIWQFRGRCRGLLLDDGHRACEAIHTGGCN